MLKKLHVPAFLALGLLCTMELLEDGGIMVRSSLRRGILAVPTESTYESAVTATNNKNILVSEEHHDHTLNGISALRAIVTGLEHSGTTITGQLLFNAPCTIGAMETGFLLAQTPAGISNVQPWFNWHRNINEYLHYRLGSDDISAMRNASNFPDMLDILRNRSFLFNDLIDEDYCQKPYQMIDKTPRYVHPENFERILMNTPGVPVIVLKKPYEALKKSWDRRGTEINTQFYNGVYNNVELMMKKYPNRIMIVEYDKLMSETESVMQDVFTFVGLTWDPDYLAMTNLKNKYSNFPDVVEKIDGWKFESGKHTTPGYDMEREA